MYKNVFSIVLVLLFYRQICVIPKRENEMHARL